MCIPTTVMRVNITIKHIRKIESVREKYILKRHLKRNNESKIK